VSHALVTGAGRGIGRAAALALAEAGADVTLAARSRNELDAVAADVEALGRRAWVRPADVTDEAAVEELVGQRTATRRCRCS
jgi:NAD(P)-dependent dehydrogenase (short-subunit alcohol dehydrogenase family)